MRPSALLRAALLAALVSSGCASSGAVPRPFPTLADDRPGPRPSAPATASEEADPRGTALASAVLALRGVPYRNGGQDPRGFDCSGLVWYVFGQQGLGVPRTVSGQFAAGRKVRPEEVRPGDLLFFDTGARPASHVGVAIGDNRFIHAPNGRGLVRVEQLAAPYWAERFVGARRFL